jgi:ElaB/YqjD/DUF883 family membrane-anchored ribosome-binding protein
VTDIFARRITLSKEKEKELREMRSIEEDVKSLRKDMDTRLAGLKDQVKDVQQKATRMATKTMAERPLLALGVAFVAGMAVGIALSKSRD